MSEFFIHCGHKWYEPTCLILRCNYGKLNATLFRYASL